MEEEEKWEAERKQWEEEERKRQAEAALEAEQELREQGWQLDELLEEFWHTNGGRRNGGRWTRKTEGHA